MGWKEQPLEEVWRMTPRTFHNRKYLGASTPGLWWGFWVWLLHRAAAIRMVAYREQGMYLLQFAIFE